MHGVRERAEGCEVGGVEEECEKEEVHVDQEFSPNDRIERMYEQDRKLTIYLAGALTDQPESVAMDWRINFRKQFGEEFEVVLPQDKLPRMEHLKGSEKWHAAIVAGERRDLVNCNAVVANIDIISMGTAMGILYAYLGGRTVVLMHTGSEEERESISPPVLFHSHCLCSTAEEAVNFIRARHDRNSIVAVYARSDERVPWDENILEQEISMAFKILQEEKKSWEFLENIDPLILSDAVVMQLEDQLETGELSHEVLSSEHIMQITEKLFMANAYRDEVSDLAMSYIRYRDRLKRKERSNQFAEDTLAKLDHILHDIKSPIGNLRRVVIDDLPRLKEMVTSKEHSKITDEIIKWISTNVTDAFDRVKNWREKLTEEYTASKFCLIDLINELDHSYHSIDFDTSGVEEDLFFETNKFKLRGILNVLTDNARDHGFIAGEVQRVVISAGSGPGNSGWLEFWNAGRTIYRVDANHLLSGSIKRSSSSGWGVGLSQLKADVGDMGGSVRCHPCIENESSEGVVSISEADIGSPRFRFEWDDIQIKNPGKLRILVADDEENARGAVQRILKDDFDVVLCDSIDKAIACAKEQTFFGAVLDVDFKEENRDGINLAEKLKEIDPSIRIVVVSGRHSRLASGDDWRVRADRAGALKSFDKADYRSADLLREFNR